MKTKKIMSLLLAFALTVTSTVNCFAGGSNSGSDSEYDSDDSVSEFLDKAAINPGNENWREKVDELEKKRLKVDARVAALNAAYEQEKKMVDKLNEELCEKIRENGDLKLQVEVIRKERDDEHNANLEWEDDVMCRDCCPCGRISSELVSLIRRDTNPIPVSSVFRSRRFYKGVLTGAAIVAVVLIGMYVFVYFIQAPARSA